MSDPDDSFGDDIDDDLVLAYIAQEQLPIEAQPASTTAAKVNTTRSPPAKRDRKRSHDVNSIPIAENSVRNMKPRVEAAVVVRVAYCKHSFR